MPEQFFQVTPIGTILSSQEGFVLVVEPPYRAALQGLEGFSHVNVLWWAHHLDQPQMRAVLTCEKPYRKSPELLGVFATRSPARPNPLALSVAQVIRLDVPQGRLVLAYIDAEDGTPVLDLKPYLPCSDRVRAVSTPAWNRHWPQCTEDSGRFDWSAEFVNAQ